MLVLSGLLAIGRGVQKDPVGAYKWAYIVGEASHIDEFKNGARQLVTLLETRMSPAEIAKGKSDAEHFHATKSQSSSTPAPADNAGSNPAAGSAAPAGDSRRLKTSLGIEFCRIKTGCCKRAQFCGIKTF